MERKEIQLLVISLGIVFFTLLITILIIFFYFIKKNQLKCEPILDNPFLELRFFQHKSTREILNHIQGKKENLQVNIYSFQKNFLFSDTLFTHDSSKTLFTRDFPTFMTDSFGNQCIQLFYEAVSSGMERIISNPIHPQIRFAQNSEIPNYDFL